MTERAVVLDQVNELAPQLQNLLVNGDFEIWQRGAGPFTLSEEFAADEWANAALSGDTVATTRVPGKVGEYALQSAWVASQTRGVYQGIEAYKSLEGLPLTFSCWVKTSTAGKVRLSINDYTGTTDPAYSDYHTGSGDWERLTVTKQVRAGLVYPYTTWEHSFPLRVGVTTAAGTVTFVMDGATLIIGEHPGGVSVIPETPASALMKCQRFFQYFPFLNRRLYASTGNMLTTINLPVPMRAAPTVTVGSWALNNCDVYSLEAGDEKTLHHTVSGTVAGSAYANATDVKLEVA
jgi:hypothetical protein